MEQSDEPAMKYEEHEEFIQRIKDRNKRLGIEVPKIEVRYEDLTVEAEVSAGKRVLPTLPNTTMNAAQELLSWIGLCPTRRRHVKILNCFSGVIRPSRMTLVLGSPGSGKSTFLRALSQKLDPSLKVSGKITYNGQKLNQTISQMTCAYVSQHDLHHAEMTVRETFEFSQRMLNAGDSLKNSRVETARQEEGASSPEMAETYENQYARERCEYIIKMLGLEECADTIIGDEMRRGISGGQKKRATIGEMLVGLAQVFFMDDISTGLDSSTTFQTLKFLQQLTHNLDLTMAISLLQPPQETYELFDDVILLCDGVIAYQGPREEVLDFFESMGFRCPDRKNVPDFLHEVISRMDQAQYWVGTKSEYQYVPVQKFSDSFKSFHVDHLIEEQLHIEYTLESGQMGKLQKTFRVQKWEVFKACFSREILLTKRNFPVHVFKNVQIALLAFVIMTVFIRSEMSHQSITDGNKWLGAIFAGVVIVKFNGMTELSIMIKRLPIYYKQRELLFLPGWSLLLSLTILSLPMSLIETGLWTSLTYYTIGFAPSVVRFLQQFLAFFCEHQMSMALFRFIAVVGKTQLMANMLGTATLVAVYILGGFVISKDDIQPWLVWGYWLSPMTYGQNAVAINEFLDRRWSTEVVGAQTPAETVGISILRSRGMLTEWHWFWYCVAILLSFALLFNIFSILALEYLKAPRNSHSNRNALPKDIKKATVAAEEVTRGTVPSSRSIALPFQPLTLTFKHISYYVDTPKKLRGNTSERRLQLLSDVSGAFRPGVLTVLMGVTGAGKTTLLDVLAGRKTTGQIQGSISISGHPKKQETFARISGYCEQTDNHSAFLTVHESLWYSAWLRLPPHVDASTRQIFINEVMELVELKQLENTMVGLPGRNGLAAEARKRLTMAVELVSSPSIIFMDEPTTGLDARAAAIVMRTVRKTADTGRTIVCTIHQPSIEIFEAFDELLLMKKGGRIIYGGPLGHLSQDMIRYFEAIPGVPKIGRGQNPATWMLEVTSPSMEHKLDIDFETIFQNSSLYKTNMGLVDELSNNTRDLTSLEFHSVHAKSFWIQCRSCFWKQHKSYWKNPEHNIVRFVITITMSVLFGIVFFGIGSKIQNEQDIFNILGAMYGSALFLGFANASILQPVVEMERIAFYRERAAGMYTSMPYAIAQVAIEVPYNLAQVFIFSAIAYPMIGFQFTIAKFFWFMLFVFLSFIYFTIFGMMTVALTPNQEIAALLSFLVFILWNIFSGFFIPRKRIPVWWRWYYWGDPAAWTIYGLMASQLGDSTDLLHVSGSPDVAVQDFLEEYFGLKHNYLPVVVSVHVAIIVLFLFVFGFSIKNLNFQKR